LEVEELDLTNFASNDWKRKLRNNRKEMGGMRKKEKFAELSEYIK